MSNAAKKSVDTAEVFQFDTETEKVFKLMIHSLYENKDIFLRELVSNASDACDKLRYKAVSDDSLTSGQPFKISVKADKEAKTLTISDNGIGMSKQDLIDNLGTIARSGTERFASAISGDAAKDSQLIGQFGVGFYSCFMVADKVEVISQEAGSKEANRWESDGSSSYTIEPTEARENQGTTITLYMREDAAEYLDNFRLNHILTTYSSHIAFDIALVGETGEEEIVNKGSAIWRKNKSEISQEEYNEFFASLSHMGSDEPWMTLHNKVEGQLEYTNLLFIPEQRPFDLFHPDRQTSVKLYIKRVFIAEQMELIPAYLRFMRGVVDSEDLPLNISRETIQNSKVMRQISQGIVKKTLAELKKRSEKDAEGYQTFWDNFGPVVKEGLCDQMEPRDAILDICRFDSTASDKADVSLATYVGRMKEGQDTIFYITGDDKEVAKSSSQLEGFKARDIEVLVLTDPVDEFWVNVVPEFEGKKLQSVTRGSFDLDSIVPLNDNKKDEEAKTDTEDGAEAHSDIVSFFKETLGDAIADARTTNKLAESPVCITAADGAMDIRMERFMMDNKQIKQGTKKVLEINPAHDVIKELSSKLDDASQKERLENVVHLLFAEANIAEGEPISDVADFTKRMNSLIAQSLT